MPHTVGSEESAPVIQEVVEGANQQQQRRHINKISRTLYNITHYTMIL